MKKGFASRPLSEADLAEVKALDQRRCDAMNRKDLDAAMACFWNSPDLVAVIMGQIQRGPEAVRAGIRQMFEQNESVRLEVNDITYVPAGDGVIAVGTATFDFKPAGGPHRLMVERWSDLRRKIDGQWVYVLDHTAPAP